MEQISPSEEPDRLDRGGADAQPPFQDASAGEVAETSSQQVIHEGIERAVTEERPIDHHTARTIAIQLCPGQGSGLHSLASVGAVVPETFIELEHLPTVIAGLDTDGDQTELVRRWAAALTAYCRARIDPGPVDGWTDAAGAEHAAAEELDEAADAAPAPVSAALGQMALTHAAELADDEDEPDTFPWWDAAHWSPASLDAALTEGLSDQEIDTLFTEAADEDIGSTDDLTGWSGLVRNTDRAGGVILTIDQHGQRHVWGTDSDDELAGRWTQLSRERDTYERQRDAYQRATGEAEDANTTGESGWTPKIWVGSLSDYNNGRLYGEWFDATLSPDELHDATQFLLRNSPEAGAEEWAIMDLDDFCGLRLGESESFETISRVAQGIVEHGDAFARWVEMVCTDNTEQLDNFQDHYLGSYGDIETYIEEWLEERGIYNELDNIIPEDIRHYITIDKEGLARDISSYVAIENANDGGIHVFDTSY